MRWAPLQWLCFALCCLVAAGCAGGARQEQKAAKAAKVATPEKAPRQDEKPAKGAIAAKAAPSTKKGETATWTVQGWGKDPHAAKEHALNNAREQVLAYLRIVNPPLDWKPDVEYLRKCLSWGTGQHSEDLDQPFDDGTKLECWTWTVSLSPAMLDLMRREDAVYHAQLAAKQRRPEAEFRMLEMAKFVGWLVLVLAGLWLYILADQWTEGARRPWLRFGLASLALGGGIGLWYLS
ncbi:MAG TPA: hypothetical protein VE988_21355 [Gemmataceae bacterium]|nr:hypothetical protein [Gemmataceae bacterium]